MRHRPLWNLLLCCALASVPAGQLGDDARDEMALDFSPVPPPPPDPTNAVYENPAAARLGQALFFDERLSGPGTISCATCHDPQRDWTDGRRVAKAVLHHARNTMSLWNVAYNRWFFWDGRKDTLWSQALAPFEDLREHASSRLQIAHVIASDVGYRRAYRDVFAKELAPLDPERFPPEGRPVEREPQHPHSLAWATMTPEDQLHVDEIFVNVGKALAAYERLLVVRNAPFDRYVEGIRERDAGKQAAISASAKRGFGLFVDKARCVFCHDGPNFTDKEFHDNRVQNEEGDEGDLGRPLGIKRLKRDPFNMLSPYADDGGEAGRVKLYTLPREVHPFPEFKTPSLRNVAGTAPYMHEGQLATLADVVEFYSTLEGARPLRPGGERLLQPLHLTAQEKADLVAFLESLTDDSTPGHLLAPPPTPYLSR